MPGSGSSKSWRLACGVMVAAGCVALPANAAAPSDTTATHAYITAALAYEQAIAAALPAAVTGVRTLVSRVSAECPRVLANAPTEGPETPLASARALGERSREQHQLDQLTEELSYAVGAPLSEAARPADAAFVAAVQPLRWTNGRIQRGVRGYIGLLKLAARPTPPIDLCADMRAWVASGYKTLPAATKSLLAPISASLVGLTGRFLSGIVGPDSGLLGPYESAADRSVLRRIAALRRGNRAAAEPAYALETPLTEALGVHERIPSFPERPAKGSVVIGRGRTAAGGRFVARLELPSSERGCRLRVEIESSGGRGFGGSSTCMSRGQRRADPSVNCSAGLLTIQSFTLAATRRVRLLLSDGSTVISSALIVPARLGGPAGLYYQVVRGPSPIPVSLTELDAHGRTVRVARLPAIVECTKHPLKYLPGGIRTLARGRIPGGPGFSIVAERYRFLGRVYLDLKLKRQESEGPGLLEASAGSGVSISFGNEPRQHIFNPEESTGCTPHPYVILYGIVKRPRVMVLAGTAAALSPLREVAIPRQLHAGGVLAFGVFSPPPSELVIRARGGRTLARESLAERSRGTVEQCEGEAEH